MENNTQKPKSRNKQEQWHGKTRGGNLGYWIFIKILDWLGLGFAYFILRFVVIYFALFAPKATKNQFHFLRKVHGFSVFKAATGVIKNYFMFGKIILDKMALMSGVKTNFTYKHEGEHYLHQMAADKKGGLLVGAHFGNWEIAGQLLERIDTKVHVLMLDAEHAKIKAMLDKSMHKKTINVIAIRTDMSHLLKIKEAFARNEFVAMHGDRFLSNTKHFYCNFFKQKAAFPTGPFYMAMKFGVPITFVSAAKESNTHYHFFSSKPNIYKNISNPKLRDEKIREIQADYISNLETLIIRYPYQWFNYYDFWSV